eukprot:497243-Amphidinium_carterae.1
MLFRIETRFMHWKKLPWRLFGLIHPDMAVAQRCAQECLNLFDSAASDDPTMHHRLTWTFLGPGQVRDEVTAFAQGRTLSDLPLLQARAEKLYFAYTVERSIEGKHSVVHKATIGKTSGPTLVSMSVRMAEIESYLSSSQDAFRWLSSLLENTRQTRKLPKLIGIHRHPTLQKILAEKGLNLSCRTPTSRLVQCVEALVYSTMPSMQFMTFTDARRANAKKKASAKRAVAKRAPRQQIRFDDVVQNALVEHFRSQCSKVSLGTQKHTAHASSPHASRKVLGVKYLHTSSYV